MCTQYAFELRRKGREILATVSPSRWRESYTNTSSIRMCFITYTPSVCQVVNRLFTPHRDQILNYAHLDKPEHSCNAFNDTLLLAINIFRLALRTRAVVIQPLHPSVSEHIHTCTTHEPFDGCNRSRPSVFGAGKTYTTRL